MRMSKNRNSGDSGRIGYQTMISLIGVSFASWSTACCLSACSPSTMSLPADGTAFVQKQLLALKPGWNASQIRQALDPEFDPTTLDGILKECAQTLGPITDVEPVRAGKNGEFRMGAGPDYVGSYAALLTCKKGKVQVVVVAEHLNGKWLFRNFNVDSSLFANLTRHGQKEAMAFAKNFVEKWADNGFTLEMLQQNATPELTKQLKQDELAAKMLFASMKGMGKLKKLSAPEFKQISPHKSGTVYAIVIGGDFSNNMHATIFLEVTEVAGKWKVCDVQMNSMTNFRLK